MSNFYLGIDSSTQGMKGVVIEPESGKMIDRIQVRFGDDLPQFNCPDGFLPNADPRVKQADPLMWAAALDLLLERLQKRGLAPHIAGICGDGQQHGSVYLNAEFPKILSTLDARGRLDDLLLPALARPTAPIWMDSSTTEECEELDEQFQERLQSDTGSPAIERFTGAQIRKFAKESPECYAKTDFIHLVSSFLCSILIGESAPIDTGDGAGMNLLNLKSGKWDPELTTFIAPELFRKLPKIGKGIAGGLSPYFTKYGLKAGIPVSVWTGDNPASLVGSGAALPGCAVVSLGTSDTFFAAMDTFKTDPEGCGHVFGNPAGGFMSLVCFKNGSLARERIRRDLNVDWTFFDEEAFKQSKPGGNRIALPWFEPEITPPSAEVGLRANFDFDKAPPALKIRAVIEGQCLNFRRHSRWIGTFDTLRITGGASKSIGIRQTLADIFQAKVESISTADSAALGGAMMAAVSGGYDLETLTKSFSPVAETCRPRPEFAASYPLSLEKELDRLAREKC